MFFRKLVEMKNDKVKFDIISKTNEDYISVTYVCIRLFDSYRILSSSLASFVKRLVDDSPETLKKLKEIVGNDEIIYIVNEIEEEEEEEDGTIKDIKKDYTEENIKLEEVLPKTIGENDLKILKTEFPDKWKFLTKKLSYPYDCSESIDDYQKPVDNIKQEDFFSK